MDGDPPPPDQDKEDDDHINDDDHIDVDDDQLMFYHLEDLAKNHSSSALSYVPPLLSVVIKSVCFCL